MTRRVKQRPPKHHRPGPASLPDPVAFAVAVGQVQALYGKPGYRWCPDCREWERLAGKWWVGLTPRA